MTSNSVNIKDYRTEIPGQLNADSTAWVFPPVLTTNSHNKEQRWQIRVSLVKMPMTEPPEFIIITDSYYDTPPADSAGWFFVDTGINGNISKRAATVITVGKNLGKKSATNVFTQALRDALGLYNTQMKKASVRGPGVVGEANHVITMFPPMLAQVYSAVYGVKWPQLITQVESTTKMNLDGSTAYDSVSKPAVAYVQPKYNGVRGVFAYDVATSTVIMYSRRKNIYPGFAYIKAELAPILASYWTAGTQLYLDGELYKHGVALQDISGYARREDQSTDIKLNFMMYDCYVADKPDMLYAARKDILDAVLSKPLMYTQRVPTTECTSYECAQVIYKTALASGYEGAMVRLNAPYRVSFNEYHSAVLLKMKPVFDAELVVASYGVANKGKAAGALMIICETAATESHPAKQFPVTPAMEIIERVALATRMATVESNGKTHFENHWLGQKIIVEYDELSKDNVPLRARTRLTKRTWD